MKKSEGKIESNVMPCGSTNELIPALEKEGWEYLYSFHQNIPDQWADACQKAQQAVSSGSEVIKVLGQNEGERRDGVAYLYRRKRESRV